TGQHWGSLGNHFRPFEEENQPEGADDGTRIRQAQFTSERYCSHRCVFPPIVSSGQSLPPVAPAAELGNRQAALPDLAPASRKRTPIWSPLIQASSQRRKARPVVERTRKNSLRLFPSTGSVSASLAPPTAASSIRQGLLQVPSIATI